MHYTSIENIHKVIDPLFLNDLNAEFSTICETKTAKIRNEKLENFQKKLGSLKFLDPACGSGNFLTETYASLRKLENKCVQLRLGSDPAFDVYGDEFKPQVNINQFYGIEINDFAVNVAKAALWIAENQMMEETSQILHRNLEFLPLKTNATIVEGNALKMDWEYLQESNPELTLWANKVNVVSPCAWLLKYVNLKSLWLGKKAKKNIELLSQLPKLKDLTLRGIKIADFSFLHKMNLEKLALFWNSNNDLHELGKLKT